jgi:5-dehydro-2-deoxygluconokinase
MAEVGIDTSQMVKDDAGHKIGLTFTEIISPEESDILMYRNEAADLYLAADEVSKDYLDQAQMLVISGTGLAQSPSREAILKALLLAKELGVEVIFELDYRPYTWQNAEETSLYYQLVAQKADVIIGTRDEFDVLENHQGNTDEQTIATLFQYDANLIVIKSGVQGSNAYTKAGDKYHFGVFKTKVLKSFGAGDSFAAGFLYAYSHHLGIETALKYGSAAASIVISQLSSSEAMPNLAQLTEFIQKAETQGVH